LIDVNNDGTPEYLVDKADDSLWNAVPDGSNPGAYTKGAAVAANTVANVITKVASYLVTDDNPASADGSGIQPDKSIRVTVQGKVASGLTTGQTVNVRLGNTGSNLSSNPDSQNQPDSADTSNTDEVRTVDSANAAPGEVAGTPVNGEREAADTSSSLTVGQVAPQPLALASIKKVAASVNNKGTTTPGTNPFTDDVISYDLTLDVANSLPLNYAGNYTPANLVGTSISVDGTPQTRILVSDAVPANTTLDSTAPLAPAGWQAVYTQSPLTTAATAAAWTTVNPGAGVTRVGFVYTGTINSNTQVSGFRIYIKATGATGDTPAPIYNLAQAFGQSQGDTNNNVVFDESGDQAPNNFRTVSGNLVPPLDVSNSDSPYGDYRPATPEDQGNPGTPTDANADIGNNNTGTGDNGEPNKLVLTTPPTPPAPGNLKNGPQNQASAIGAIGDNDDFTSKGIAEGVTNGGTIDPNVFTFNNSVRNVSGADINNVVLRPVSPATANVVCVSCQYTINTLLNGQDHRTRWANCDLYLEWNRL
jgi:hypothetical protein